MDSEMKCQDCGTTENVRKTICPYAEDVNNEIVEVVLCDHCIYERAMEI